MVGNGVLFKYVSNVMGFVMLLEDIYVRVDLFVGLFVVLYIDYD